MGDAKQVGARTLVMLRFTSDGPDGSACQKRSPAVSTSTEEQERQARQRLDEFRQFCDRVGRKAEAAGMTEEVLEALLREAS